MRGTNRLNAPIRHDQFLRDDVIRRRSVNRNARAGGIVRDHAADRRARARGHIRAKTKTVRLEKRVELIEDNTRAGVNGARVQIQLGDLAIVARELDDQSIANRATGQTGASAAWCY